MIIDKAVIIVGAGPAGLAAAVELKKNGIDDVLVLERENNPGGILNQCIHDGFGVIKFKKSLTGPEYAHKYITEAKKLGVEIENGTMVVEITKDRVVTAVSPKGLVQYKAGAIILAMGCRERTRGALSIPGKRPAGVFTAGVAQHLVNLKNIMIGKKIVILGSGDIGLIMARRLTLEGAEVLMVVEKMPYSNGLPRNITQCLNDYNIPLLLSHTVVNIEGDERLMSVTIAKLDDKGNVIKGTAKRVECDTLVLSVGLIPENELSSNASVVLDGTTSGACVDENLETSIPGIFACGNALHVHDLVDYVSSEAEIAAKSAASFIKGEKASECTVPVKAGKGIRYVLPQKISTSSDVTISMRVVEPYENKSIVVKGADGVIKKKTFVKLNPSEMIRISLQTKDLKDIGYMEVSVDE